MHDSNNGASACVIFKQPLRTQIVIFLFLLHLSIISSAWSVFLIRTNASYYAIVPESLEEMRQANGTIHDWVQRGLVHIISVTHPADFSVPYVLIDPLAYFIRRSLPYRSRILGLPNEPWYSSQELLFIVAVNPFCMLPDSPNQIRLFSTNVPDFRIQLLYRSYGHEFIIDWPWVESNTSNEERFERWMNVDEMSEPPINYWCPQADPDGHLVKCQMPGCLCMKECDCDDQGCYKKHPRRD